MKKMMSILVGSLVFAGVAHAATVDLVSATPDSGPISVKYQLLSQSGQATGEMQTVTLPFNVEVPDSAQGVIVTEVHNHFFPGKDHWLVVPEPKCTWKKDSGRPAQILFTATQHDVGCQ